jgi:hypothetical protein
MHIQHLRIFILVFFVAILMFGCGDTNPVDSEVTHFEAIGLFALIEEDTVVKYIDGVVTGNFTAATGLTSPKYQLLFLDEDGNVGIPPTNVWSLGWEIGDTMIADVVSTQEDHSRYEIQYSGLKEGQTTIKIQIFHNDHKDFESDSIPLVVGLSDPRPKN